VCCVVYLQVCVIQVFPPTILCVFTSLSCDILEHYRDGSYLLSLGHDMAQAVTHWPLTTEACVQPQASRFGICRGGSSTGTSFSLCTLVVPCHYCSISAPYSYFIYLPPTLQILSSSITSHEVLLFLSLTVPQDSTQCY
jgi:hypothetical protein